MHTLIILRDAVCMGVAFGAGIVLDEKSLIPLGTACAIGAIIFWLGRKIQQFEDSFKLLKESLDKLPCQQDEKNKAKDCCK